MLHAKRHDRTKYTYLNHGQLQLVEVLRVSDYIGDRTMNAVNYCCSMKWTGLLVAVAGLLPIGCEGFSEGYNEVTGPTAATENEAEPEGKTRAAPEDADGVEQMTPQVARRRLPNRKRTSNKKRPAYCQRTSPISLAVGKADLSAF